MSTDLALALAIIALPSALLVLMSLPHIIISASPTNRLSHPTRAIRVSLASLHTAHVPRRRSGDRM